MFAGKLDRRLTILRKAPGDDGFTSDGGEVWATFATVWGSKVDLLDAERYRASELGTQGTTRFQVRHSATTAAITPMDRITHGGLTYEITGIKEIGRQVGIEFTGNARLDK